MFKEYKSSGDNIREKILALKKEKNAVILAHYYQVPEIQDVADFVGDSLGLSMQAASTDADIIVFAGVHFMAETAKILNPRKKVLLPDLNAGCSLADNCSAEQLRDFKARYPGHVVVTYINCSAEVKAESDIICTSANAVKVVNSIPEDLKIIFAPDKNLGRYVSKVTGRDLVLWDGVCNVHDNLSTEKLKSLMNLHPDSKIVAHPESASSLLELADFIGSTTAMMDYVSSSDARKFIVATEAGILHKMSESVKDKMLIPAPAIEDNACACSECPYMKLNTLEKLHDALLNETPAIDVDDLVRFKALKPLERMLELK